MLAVDPESAVSCIIELVKMRIPRRFGLDPTRDIQVLCPMNRGGVGARSLEIELQPALNPAGERKVERFGWTFAPGDKVTENDYDKDFFNGDIGFIDEVNPNAGEVVVSFDGRPFGDSTCWFLPMPPQSTRARAWNILVSGRRRWST